MTDTNILEFRRHMGPLVEGKTDAELAEMHATLQWIADQAIDEAIRQRTQAPARLQRSA